MNKKDIEKSMERFGQADSGLNRKHEGTGLGLPLVKGLIELHGGSVSIDSTMGEGTVVLIVLPPERTITIKMNDKNKTDGIFIDGREAIN